VLVPTRIRRPLVLALALSLVVAACGGDDDGKTESAGASKADFCTVWPKLNEETTGSGALPTKEQIEEARTQLAEVRASAPKEIKKEVDHMVGLISGLIDSVESGGDDDDDSFFGDVFDAALTDGPKIEAYLTKHCPGYVPSAPFGGDSSTDTGSLGIPEADLDSMIDAALPDEDGATSNSVGDRYELTLTGTYSAADALSGCTALSKALAANADASGTLTLTVADEDEKPVAVNKKIEPGHPGTCVAA
jgi:hypothetical protein